MTNEEFEKRMEFIIEQQAQFASDIQRLQEAQGRLQEAQGRTEQVVAQTGEIVARLANVTQAGFQDVIGKINVLVDSQMRLTEAHIKLSESHGQLSESHGRLSESQSRTDEALRNFIAVVDRYFREGRNGESRH